MSFRPYNEFIEYTGDEMLHRAETFYSDMKRRRTIRQFSDRAVDRKVIEKMPLSSRLCAKWCKLATLALCSCRGRSYEKRNPYCGGKRGAGVLCR